MLTYDTSNASITINISTLCAAYHLTDHPIAIHWDMDMALLQPLDEMYNIMVYPPEHVRNIEARESIEQQHPEEKWP